MPTCANCGHSLSPGTAFCPACGAPAAATSGRVAGEPPAAPGPPPAEQPAPSTGQPIPVPPIGQPVPMPPTPAGGGDEAPTRILPPDTDQTPTRVLPASTPAATQVMPPGMVRAGGSAEGPPSAGGMPPRAPGGQAGRPFWGEPAGAPGSSSKRVPRRALWIGAAVVAGCIILVAALWALGVFGDEDEFTGDWWALDDSGGLVIQENLDVWVVEPDGTKVGPMKAEIEDDTLTFTLNEAALEALADGDRSVVLAFKDKVTVAAIYDDASGHLETETTITGDVGKFAGAIEPTRKVYKRVDALPTTPPSPSTSATPSASPSPSPSASPSPTGTGEPSASPSASPTGGTVLQDQEVKSSADAIAAAIEAYISDNGAAPATGSVVPGGALEPHLPASSWPVNVYTDAPMTEGTGIGDYTYVGNADGTFSLSAHLGDGTDYTLD